MPYSLQNRLVVGVASSALFDLKESDQVFRDKGEEEYRKFQEENLGRPLGPGVAFPFIKRILSLNDLAEPDEGNIVEVIVLSRNDPDTGLRVMESVKHHELDITRAIFMQGKSPYKFIPALNVSLFLSANERDVREALALNLPAGRVLESTLVDDDDDDLRIAFDFDGVLADDGSEQVMQAKGLSDFHDYERVNLVTPHNPGPLRDFLIRVAAVQKREQARKEANPKYNIRLHVAMVTARNAPSHERPLRTLKDWGVMVNDAFFLGGIDKGEILRILRPHIFFDDQIGHLTSTSQSAPSVHIPFGELNALPQAGDSESAEGHLA
ncbi:5'-nucleotidase (plasmid) [Arthrobacter sp. TES]|jgi:5'-nucleotidase|uniref:5'-nucleotidase (5'-NT) n=3 Tax=Micrococcaceae TaxID=1268 RepID=Q6SKF7_PAEAU|nr:MULTISPECIES: 5'-nucleotidase [Micrococcaceae]AAS20014.1 5'-nucleotidase (5'-NT) [Paenarthrobacter aurescens]ERI35271.1 5'-nucleotidase [Arthrobacter sp. AK-YN10]QOI65910.1 5'-nucleotidase [Arthrobacter sp. TES]ABM10569.1 putative 5'-Nucleotidase [Paenarthrobacter aurescens TC1]MCY0975519.1 5'-nucleotidase [Paenarthrobacter ureafaciens]